MKNKASFGFGTAFVVSFALTSYLLAMDRTASATIGAGLTLSMGLFCFLPTLESFQAFGLNAQFRKKLDEADRLLALLRETGSVSARLLTMSLAWSNRMASPPETEKMEQMAELNAVITKLDLPADRVKQIQEPFVRMAVFDLASAFFRATRPAQYAVLSKYEQDTNPRLLENRPEEVEEIMRTKKEIGKEFGEGAFDLKTDDLFSAVKMEAKRLDFLAQYGLPNEDYRMLDAMHKQVLKLMEDCQKNANLTREAAEFLQEQQRIKRNRYSVKNA